MSLKIKAVVVPIANCSPLLMDDEVRGTATLGDGSQLPAILSRKKGMVDYLTTEGEPLNRIVKFFDYEAD
jgi:hypothetical protein